MYIPIPITDALCGFDIPPHQDERRTLRYMLRQHIINKGLHGMSVCLHIHNTGGNRADFLSIFKIPIKNIRINNLNNYTKQLMKAITNCRALAPNLCMKQVLNEVKQLLSTNAGTANSKVAQRVFKLLNNGLSST